MNPAIHLSLLFSRARWQRLCHEAMLEHRRGALTDETIEKVETAERQHRELHGAVLETMR